ncbi:hypothetical protein [uncultured Methanobrevibacter sp.]|uniref:hypothetical protein n=1 Tax=uncultured Methanobrevibacter sp. TaxID=253161 RepID=UPI0026DF1079|nr:hypothetical protein [uncultured Methanobrevibacter sp.]
MSLKPVLILKHDEGIVKVRSRLRDDSSEHEIVLNSVLNYYWTNKLNPVEKFLELFESVIKRTVNELIPHRDLYLKYEYKLDDDIEHASKIEINLLNVVADDIGFKIEGNRIQLDGFRNREEDPDKISSFVDSTVEKHIETPEIVYKKYMERMNKD